MTRPKRKTKDFVPTKMNHYHPPNLTRCVLCNLGVPGLVFTVTENKPNG